MVRTISEVRCLPKWEPRSSKDYGREPKSSSARKTPGLRGQRNRSNCRTNVSQLESIQRRKGKAHLHPLPKRKCGALKRNPKLDPCRSSPMRRPKLASPLTRRLSQGTASWWKLPVMTLPQSIEFQGRKRLTNARSVVEDAADELGDKEVSDHEPDPDWAARFFNDIQDVSSEEMQSLWAKVLAGEVERPGSTSIRTLSILRNLDQTAARLFGKLCSACVSLRLDGDQVIDARVPSLGGNAATNALQKYWTRFWQPQCAPRAWTHNPRLQLLA